MHMLICYSENPIQFMKIQSNLWNPLIWKYRQYRHIGNHQYRRIGISAKMSYRHALKQVHQGLLIMLTCVSKTEAKHQRIPLVSDANIFWYGRFWLWKIIVYPGSNSVSRAQWGGGSEEQFQTIAKQGQFFCYFAVCHLKPRHVLYVWKRMAIANFKHLTQISRFLY